MSEERMECLEDEFVEEPVSLTKMELLRSLKSKTKEKTKKLLNVNDRKNVGGPLHESDDITNQITGDPAFNPAAIESQRKRSKREGVKAALDGVSSFATSLSSPRDAIKGKAARTTARKLSKAERPYLSYDADIEFLEANDNLSRVESSLSSRQITSDEHLEDLIGGHRDRVNEMKAHRESLRVGHATSRHVRRVRVVPKHCHDFPNREAVSRDHREGGTPKKYDWLKWIGYVLLWYVEDFSAQYVDDFNELPYNVDSIRRHIERIIIASAPWQAWAMDVRSVYRWEQPWTTARWLVAYVVLWSTDHIIGFLYAYILYISIKNHFFPSSIDSLRTSMQRAHDRNQSAYRFGELINKYGNEGWLEPLMKDMGPYIQLQLGDIANMLEVFANFYNWVSPRKTVATLWFFAACLLLSLCCDMAFCVKITGFVAGGTFFLCWPIASHYPKYRYLVSPFKWVLWDIPTDAELAFQYLRRRAQMCREQIIKKQVKEVPNLENASPRDVVFAVQTKVMPKITVNVDKTNEVHETNADTADDESWYSADSSSSVLEGTDILSFRARWGIKTGRLVVYSNGVRFVRSLRRKELWRKSFLEMAEMRKLEGSTASRLTLKRPEELELTFTDGDSIILGAMNDRDEAFNSIIGFSALQWQVS